MGNAFGGLTPVMQIDVNFASADGKEIENATDDTSYHVLSRMESCLPELEGYRGCGETIRGALSNPSDDNLQRRAFEAVCPNIELISRFHNISSDIGSTIRDLAAELTTAEMFRQKSGVAKLLGELILVCFKFDQMKMLKPELQNDFSFYRRAIGSRALAGVSSQPISADSANVVSMWLAQNLPMTSSILRETNADVVANLANLCCGMIIRDTCGEALSKVLHIMVASTVVYDRISASGAFCSQSNVKVRKVIKAIGMYGGNDKAVLANSLKYSTTHFNDASTPANIRSDLDKM